MKPSQNDLLTALKAKTNLFQEEVLNSAIVKKVEAPKCCPWHRKGFKKHVGRFGSSCECLDCLKEMVNGRCEIDVCNFDLDIYWTVKRFWDRVDIKGPDECWSWTGATKKNNTETAAYFPSPFHTGTIHSAARVAFWTSRGYTGKMRIHHKDGCDVLCCNPTHLRIREVESVPTPTEVTTINFKYGNIFTRAKEALLQAESDNPK
jgi:hypothetical protein